MRLRVDKIKASSSSSSYYYYDYYRHVITACSRCIGVAAADGVFRALRKAAPPPLFHVPCSRRHLGLEHARVDAAETRATRAIREWADE